MLIPDYKSVGNRDFLGSVEYATARYYRLKYNNSLHKSAKNRRGAFKYSLFTISKSA